MTESSDSIWYYFNRPNSGVISCKSCSTTFQQDPTKSTGNLIRHLESKHKEEERKRKNALEAIKKKKNDAILSIPKITNFASSSSASSSSRELEPTIKKRKLSGDQSVQECFAQYNSAPVGSQESERIFSSAGITLTELRNRLTGEKLEMLLFLHQSLPLYDFSY
ncbi:hypothetical protein ACQ4LE_009397 [Meloidogyne hapla]